MCQDWASECPDVKNYKSRFKSVWHGMYPIHGYSGRQRVNKGIWGCYSTHTSSVVCVYTEGVRLATRHQCKFVEISALLDHKVDELLVGIVRQIRLRQTRDEPVTADGENSGGGGGGGGGRLTTMIGGVLRRLVARATTPTRRRRRNDVASHPSLSECNNLFTPWCFS